jgi:hypothetical protein
MYGGSDEQIDYRLGITQHRCEHDAQLGYHVDSRERPLMWIGEGLAAFNVEGLTAGAELTTDQHEMARWLVRGQHPETAAQLVTPKVAVPAEAKLSLGPLVAAVRGGWSPVSAPARWPSNGASPMTIPDSPPTADRCLPVTSRREVWTSGIV